MIFCQCLWLIFSMATATPDRQQSTPKGRPQGKSPRTPSSATTVGASRVHDMVRKIVDMYQKWQITVQKGAQYCNAIEGVKKGVLESKGDSVDPFPANLELYCKNLAILNTILDDVIRDLERSIKKLRLEQTGLDDGVIGRTWNLQKLISVLEDVGGLFKKQLELRKTIAENIGHCITPAELALHVVFWEQLSSQNGYLSVYFEMMKCEFNIDEGMRA
ncbi:uncharacterized protein LOC129749312 [Uranotaenia lowii]|uniref:uncharacterized protein LOC129749311 n=1 Tax=Uranotaenia lowii TaxID=190385 RepID=UPI002478604E|nr:uncharacterized protein LOC129749311 [Uranotaenia lowii]XP_055600231.1 uncharacterized protein LOC129749312 [Uranotaenia lowii]